MHPAVWMSWVFAVMAIALMTTNPFYLVVLLLCIVLVGALAPRSPSSIAGFRGLAMLGASAIGVSVLIAAVNGGYGSHVLVTVPGPEFPSWMGGLRLGGPVTAESLVAATTRGLAIFAVFLGFAVLSGAVSPYRLLRLGPAPLFQAALVVTIGLTLLPAIVEDFRRVAETRALRGANRGISALPGLIVPSMTGGLDRSLRLAEALEARGYAASAPLPLAARLAALGAVVSVLVAGGLWLYGDAWRWLALPGFLATAALVGTWLSVGSRARSATRMAPEPFPPRDRVSAVVLLGLAATAIVLRVASPATLAYNPFERLAVPPFEPSVLALVLGVLLPAALLLASPRPAAAETTADGAAFAELPR